MTGTPRGETRARLTRRDAVARPDRPKVCRETGGGGSTRASSRSLTGWTEPRRQKFPVRHQQRPQPRPRAAYARLHGAQRNAHRLRDLGIVHALYVAQDNGYSLVLRQPGQRRLNGALQLPALRVFLQSGAGAGWFQEG